MQKKPSKRSSILFLLSSQTAFPLKTLDSLPSFKGLLSSGVSSFLLKPRVPSLLISILGFSKTFPEGFSGLPEPVPGKELVRFEDVELEEKAQIIEEDTMTEIRYIESPETFSQVSSKMKTLVITNSVQNAGFCQKISLDYLYDQPLDNLTDGKKTASFLKGLLGDGAYNVIIIDLVSEEKGETTRIHEALQILDQGLPAFDQDLTSFYLLVSPYLVGEAAVPFLSSHKSEVSDSVRRIIPKQTYEYLNGNLNSDFVDLLEKKIKDYELAYCFLFEKGGCRKDRIDSFEILEVDPIKAAKLAGNKTINSHIFLRELTFRLGKLPKFGA